MVDVPLNQITLLISEAFSYETLIKRGKILMVIIIVNGHGEPSSNPGQDILHFTNSTNTLGKSMNQIFSL